MRKWKELYNHLSWKPNCRSNIQSGPILQSSDGFSSHPLNFSFYAENFKKCFRIFFFYVISLPPAPTPKFAFILGGRTFFFCLKTIRETFPKIFYAKREIWGWEENKSNLVEALKRECMSHENEKPSCETAKIIPTLFLYCPSFGCTKNININISIAFFTSKKFHDLWLFLNG
jgi:hypothetical protein